jgi:uncharacterized membrane protein (DUF373 family)
MADFTVWFAIVGVFGTLFYMLWDEYRFVEDID